jgi:hypothetical protein
MLWRVSSRDGWWSVSLVNEMLRAAVQHGTRGRFRLCCFARAGEPSCLVLDAPLRG